MIRILAIARTVWLEMIRRKDLYVALILLLALLMTLLSVNVYGLANVSRYVKDLGLLLTMVFAWILSINSAGRQLPQEEAKGTIYPLLAKPITRAELLLGKWLGAWSIAAVATVVFYALVASVVRLRGGGFSGPALLQALALHLTSLGIICGIALALSTRTTYGAAAALAYLFTFAAYAVAPQVPVWVLEAPGFRATALLFIYYALPHLDLFDMRQRVVHDWGAIPWTTFAVIVIYGVLWMAVCLLVAWLAYREKRFVRGARM